MSRVTHALARVKKALTSWFVAPLLLAAIGVAVGAVLFTYTSPGKPKIGVIDIPFTVLNEDSTYVISEFLSYARRDDSIKAVVIRLTSPGGGASSSERLYFETRELREEKPVVVVMNALVASGGYMMSLGANYAIAQPSSLVGNVGVISTADPLIPPPPEENVLVTGPFKASGFSRRQHVELVDQLNQSFAQLVVVERGDRLKLSAEELAQGRIYAGIDALQLGMIDELGGDTEAMEKAADLAGISGYGIVDVNLEVLRHFAQASEDIFASLNAGNDPVLAEVLASLPEGSEPGAALSVDPEETAARLQGLRKLLLTGSLGEEGEDPLPNFPFDIARPNIYYLYVGNDL